MGLEGFRNIGHPFALRIFQRWEPVVLQHHKNLSFREARQLVVRPQLVDVVGDDELIDTLAQHRLPFGSVAVVVLRTVAVDQDLDALVLNLPAFDQPSDQGLDDMMVLVFGRREVLGHEGEVHVR